MCSISTVQIVNVPVIYNILHPAFINCNRGAVGYKRNICARISGG